MTKEESILISAYTGYYLTNDFSEVHALCEKALGRPIFSHEFASEELGAEIREKLLPMIQELRFDDEPVKHGRWIPIWKNLFTARGYKCSVCGAIEKQSGFAYCHCGAKMDG